MSRDPDELAVHRSAVRIGWQVAAVSAGLVVVIIGLVFAYVLWQSSAGEEAERHATDTTRIFVDRDELLAALAVIGAGAVVLAGAATWLIARRAVVPLGDALRLQRTFVADASHELRTPLTVMSARVQQLQRRIRPDDENAAVVAALREDTRSLAAIVDDLLRVAALEPDGERLESALLPEVVRAARDLGVLADERDVRIEYDRVEVSVAVPSTALRRCIVALLDNAVGHAPAGSVVSVSVHAASTTVELSVQDQGDGIRGIDPARVFDRFAHGSHSAGSGTRRASYGIGLALVREVVLRHGGSVRVGATGPDGTTFVLTLPRAETPSANGSTPSRPDGGASDASGPAAS